MLVNFSCADLFRKFEKMSQNLSSARVVIGTLRVNFFNKLFQEYYQGVKQFKSRPDQTFCLDCSGPKLVAMINSI